MKAAAANSGLVFLSATGAEIFSPYVGESEKKVTELFRAARLASPAVLFIDEVGKSLLESRHAFLLLLLYHIKDTL